MNKNNKKIFIILCFFFLTNIIFPKTIRLIGNFIKLEVYDENGKFIIYGRNNIKDKFVPLLFEDSPPTSYFRFFKEQKRLPFGEGGRGRYSEIAIIGNNIEYFWQDDKIKIDIVYKLVASSPERSLDTLIMDLNIMNNGLYQTRFDFFSCIDTYLGEKSKDHFVLSTGEVVDMEKEFKDSGSIDYVQSASKEKKLGINIFLNDKTQIKPSRVYFVNWKKVEKSIDLYKVFAGRTFNYEAYSINDSGMFIEYTDQKIIPNTDNKYRFIISMRNNIQLSDEKNKSEDVKIEEDSSMDKNKDKQKDDNKLNLLNMSLKELLELLDKINKKLESGQKLTDDEVDLTTKILEEIKKRRGYE